MTSLAHQLEKLKDAGSQQLSAQQIPFSVLFSKKEAAALYKEEVLRIGQAGLAQLQKVDKTIGIKEKYLFEESSLHFQRVLLTNDENEKLSTSIDRLLIQLSPYFQHFATQQVLEWLIYRYQINIFNAKTLFITFLPFHGSNIFGRLLSILDLRGIEFDWTKEFAKNELPIPFEVVVKQCYSSNHSVLSMLFEYIEHVSEIMEKDFVENKLPQLFSFYASLSIHLIADPAKVNDSLISKILPILATGLKSRIVSLRLSSLMITCQLSIAASLSETVVHSLLKLVILKMNSYTVESSIDTALVICQRQNVTKLPLKSIKKMLRKDSELGISKYIGSLCTVTDVTRFLKLLWHSMLSLLSAADNDLTLNICSFAAVCMDPEYLNETIASDIFESFFEYMARCGADPNIPDLLSSQLHSIFTRYGPSFDAIRNEWTVRDSQVVHRIMNICRIGEHETGQLGCEQLKKVTRKRKRRNSMAKQTTSEFLLSEKPQQSSKSLNDADKDSAALLKALAAPKKEHFKGDPVNDLGAMIDSKEWKTVKLGLEKLTSKSYLKKRSAGDFEQFIVDMIKRVVTGEDTMKAAIRNALSELPMEEDFRLSLLKKTNTELIAKKMLRKRKQKSNDLPYFGEENESECEKRIIFVLEVFSATADLQPSSKFFSTLFDMISEITADEDIEDISSPSSYKLQLILTLLVRFLSKTYEYKAKESDLSLDFVVKVMRTSHNQQILRDCLRILTAAVEISPCIVCTQMMSLFTFMGTGTLKKDDNLTLSVIEETLRVFFSAVVSSKIDESRVRLVELCRIFAAAIADIPAHRRSVILNAVASASTPSNLWIVVAVFFEQFCVRWQKIDAKPDAVGRTSIERLEEMSLEMVSAFEAPDQLLCAVNLLEYIVHLKGDFPRGLDVSADDSDVFDRTKYSLQKLRHFRFAVIGWVGRLLSSSNLFDKLADLADDDLYEKILLAGRRLLICSMVLNDFVTTETELAQEADSGEARTLETMNAFKYWIAVSSRADIVAEKIRSLLPVNVSGRLIADILNNPEISPALRDRALQLLNVKLMQENLFSSANGIRSEHLVTFATKMSNWIKPVSSKDEVLLCQSAAFSLKLIIKRLPQGEGQEVLANIVEKCSHLVKI
ncbi:hypothetical protein AB6A40_004206 [Gnathostoma spinigerum]|uniref:HEAT repeat-containing protein 1 n=1 Tax=Gnathostoma spinigerum TaxID=75299 RepID=A0ABD6ELQ3_9BILA